MTTPQNHADTLVQTLLAAGCTSQQAHAFMLTLVYVTCARCGSTRETVVRDRELLGRGNAVCCEPEPAEPAESRVAATRESRKPPEVPCYYCGTVARPEVGSGKRSFCCKACWRDYAE
jgi:hypothetical protein